MEPTVQEDNNSSSKRPLFLWDTNGFTAKQWVALILIAVVASFGNSFGASWIFAYYPTLDGTMAGEIVRILIYIVLYTLGYILVFKKIK